MESLISSIMATDSPILVVIFALFITFVVIKELYGAVKWIKDRLNGYYNIRNTKEEKQETIEERLSKLEKDDEKQFNKLDILGEKVEKIIGLIKEVQATQAKSIINTHKETIFRIYHEAMKNNFITQAELDRFLEVTSLYKEAGGDGIVDEKIYPEVLQTPIKSNDKEA